MGLSASSTVAEPDRIAVVRALPGLGDMLCAVPALRALRNTFPDARIDLIGLQSAVPFVRRYAHYVDELVPFPGFPGIPEGPQNHHHVDRFHKAMRGRHYDLAVQMHGSGVVMNEFVAGLGASAVVGCCPPCGHTPVKGRFVIFDPQESEVARNLRVVELAGAVDEDTRLEFPVSPEDMRDAYWLTQALDIADSPFAVVHAGASTDERTWPIEYFAAIVSRYVELGVHVILTGVFRERDRIAALASAVPSPLVHDAAGLTTVGELAALLMGASASVCGDTGVAHLAAAVRSSGVTFFRSDQVARWGTGDDDRRQRLVAPFTIAQAVEAAERALPMHLQAAPAIVAEGA